jgi:hypothetical protein
VSTVVEKVTEGSRLTTDAAGGRINERKMQLVL